jgi:hypothetical protein
MPSQALGHPGNGDECGVCGEILTTAKLMMEISQVSTVIHIHGDCYLLWIEELPKQ